MAYKKTNWQDTLRDAQGNVIQKGTPLNAQALGKIEDGIVAAEQKIDNEISQVTTQLAQKATKQELQNIGNASPKGTYATVDLLQTAFPVGATGIYIVTADGKWYYWNGSAWTAGGVYQSTSIVEGAVNRTKLADVYSLNDDLVTGTDLKMVAKEGTFTGKANGNYINVPSNYNASYAFMLEVRAAYKGGNRWFVQTLTELIYPYKKWRILVDATGTYSYNWKDYDEIPDASLTTSKLSNNIVTRAKLSDDFMVNYSFISATGDVDVANKQGNYLVIAGAKNTPLPNSTFTLSVDIHKTSSASTNTWLTQTATTADGDVRVFVRKKYNSGTFSSWAELTNTANLNSKFKGKNIICFGDSITENGDYPERIANLTGANVTSIGFGGCRMTRYAVDSVYTPMCMAKVSEYIASSNYAELETAAQTLFEMNGDDNRPQVQRLKATDFSKVDYITIFHGTNDYGGNMPIGESADATYDTFKGAINLVINNILTTYPHIKLLFVSPYWRATYTGVTETVDSDVYPNPLGHYLINYVDALIERAHANHIPVLDLYRESGINKYNYNHYLKDGLHPRTITGNEHIANKILAGLNSKF